MAAIQQISSLSSGRIKTYSFSAVSLEHHRLFSLEKKRSNVQDSDNRDFHITVLILRLTHTPEEARTAKVVSTEGEMFIVADTECLLSKRNVIVDCGQAQSLCITQVLLLFCGPCVELRRCSYDVLVLLLQHHIFI